MQPPWARAGPSLGPASAPQKRRRGTAATRQPSRAPGRRPSGQRGRPPCSPERAGAGSCRSSSSRGAEPWRPAERQPHSWDRALPRLLPARQGPPLCYATRAPGRRGRGRANKLSSSGLSQVFAASLRAADGAQRSRPRPRVSRPPRPASAGSRSPAASRRLPPPRARHHGAPARRLAAAAARSPSAPRGAQQSRCEGWMCWFWLWEM